MQQGPTQQQQNPGQQGAGQQPLTQQNPQRVEQQSQFGGAQQRTQQPPQSQSLQGSGQPQFTAPASAGPYGSQSAMLQSPTTYGPSVQSPVSELSAGDTAGTQLPAGSSPARPQWQSAESHQAPIGGNGYEQAIAQELRAAVDGLDQLANVAEWAETRFAQQGNADASRACEDIHDRAHTTADFILRGSPFAASAARELQETIGGAMQELQRHPTPESQDVRNRAQQANQLLDAAVSRLTPAGSATQ